MQKKNHHAGIIPGLILITLGVAFLADKMKFLNFGQFIDFLWPSILLLFGVTVIIKGRNIFLGGLFLLLGGFFLSVKFYPELDGYFWPVILIGFGILILLPKSHGHNRCGKMKEEESKDDTISDTIVFFGLDKKVTSENFKGGEVVCVFGGGKIDLKNAKISDGANLDVTCVFGGLEVIIPENVRLVNNGSGILGGFEDKSETKPQENAPTLTINGTAVFGGVEIK